MEGQARGAKNEREIQATPGAEDDDEEAAADADMGEEMREGMREGGRR